MFERLSAEPIYNTRAVVRRTGIPADTFRAWERRYGVPVPSRTAGNQRLYSERDIATIGWLREQTQTGMTISQAVALLRSRDAERPRSAHSAPPPLNPQNGTAGEGLPAVSRRTGDAGPLRDMRGQLVASLLALDGNAADQIVEESLALTNVEDVCLGILQGALMEIGDRWEHGSANVAIEHFAASYVQRKFAALFNQSNPNDGRGPIVAACPGGEQHDIGLLLTSLFLSRSGYRVIYLGANMPLDDLVETVRRVQAPIVMLSAAREATAHRIAAAIEPLKRAVDDAGGRDLPEIGYGGQIFARHPELRSLIDGAFLGYDAREAAENVDRIFAGLPIAAKR